MDKETAINNATAYAKEVCNIFNPFLIIMYGSYANGNAHQDSDIDVAVIFDGYTGNWLKDSSQLWKLTRNISTDIEPILLDKTKDPSGFVEEIMKTGEVLYSVVTK
ncbi:MAG: nucleotidyltransferase domain-containing protein [Oscillospiraceae bacterium]|jgi:predicted nucleotidyltransferase|nr:nucleotidyltransferase domain-containing protein [Oscillospiraceae bacterium]